MCTYFYFSHLFPILVKFYTQDCEWEGLTFLTEINKITFMLCGMISYDISTLRNTFAMSTYYVADHVIWILILNNGCT
jgi:hypothetical protein